jgi:predicted MFS family arabinose efflux permease
LSTSPDTRQGEGQASGHESAAASQKQQLLLMLLLLLLLMLLLLVLMLLLLLLLLLLVLLILLLPPPCTRVPVSAARTAPDSRGGQMSLRPEAASQASLQIMHRVSSALLLSPLPLPSLCERASA